MEAVIESLLTACAEGDVSLLTKCLQYRLDLNFTTTDGLTPLIYVITCAGTNPQGDYYQTATLLLEAGSSPFAVDSIYGRTAAHWAAFCKQADLLVLLIYAKSDVTIFDMEGQSPFHIAVSNALNECVEIMIQTVPNLNINEPTLTGLTPLMLATLAGNTTLVQLLLGYGCDPNAVEPQSLQSSLHMAAESGHAPIIAILLKSHATLDTNDIRGLTPIHLASGNSTSDALSTICDIVGSDVLELIDGVGLNPLIHACISGSEPCVEFILKKKVNLLFKDGIEGKTCLHWAAENIRCSPNIIKLLCKKKKQLLSETDVHGRAPVHLAAMSGHVEALKVLLDFNSNFTLIDNNHYTPIHWAAACGQPIVLQELIDHGSPINLTEKNGATPLHLASQAAAVPIDSDDGAISAGAQCIDILLNAGASLTIRDSQGREPLHWALQCTNNLEAIQSLISKGADPKAMSYDGLTGLHMAAKYGITDNCHYLIEEAGVDGNLCDQHEQSALFYSIESQAIDCSQYLLSIGLSANHKNKEGRTPVHIAATVGSIEGLELLSSYNGDMNALSVQNVTPIHDAAASGQTGALKYLLDAGGNPNPPTNNTIPSPLHYAVSEGYTDCVQLLLDAGANVNEFTISEEKTCLTPLDYATEYPELTKLLLERNGVYGADISLPKIENVEEDRPTEKEEQVSLKDDIEDELQVLNADAIEETDHIMEDEGRKSQVATPSSLRPQVNRKHSDPFDAIRLPQKKTTILSRLMKLGRQKSPPPGSVQSSVVALYGAQATMLAAGILRTPLGDKAFKVAEKVANDTADDLKRAAASETDFGLPELDWLETPVKEPTPPPEPSPDIPPTPQPSPPPQFQLNISPSERRMRKAQAQMDESKSLAFRAMEELLKAQKTQSQMKRQFVMTQLKEESEIRKKELSKLEKEAIFKRNQLLCHYNQRIEKAANASEKMNSQIIKQLENAHKVNTEVATSMSALGISPRPTVSEWLKRKDKEKTNSLKTSLHNWNTTKQQREVAISLKQAITSHRALHHIAWGTKKELLAKIHAKPIHSYTSDKTVSKSLTTAKVSSNLKAKTTHKPSASTGCVRTIPANLLHLKSNQKINRHQTSSLPDCGLWEIGQNYVGSAQQFYPNLRHRAYGPKNVHAERTLHFLSPSEYKKKRSNSKILSLSPMKPPHSSIQLHFHDDGKSSTITPTQAY